jgi:hypothetical protein
MILLSIAFLLIDKGLNFESLQAKNKIIPIFCINIFILGLLLIILTKEKVEDEMLMALRFKAMGFTFMSAVIFVMIEPLFNQIEGSNRVSTSSYLVIAMLIAHIIYFFILKRFR